MLQTNQFQPLLQLTFQYFYPVVLILHGIVWQYWELSKQFISKKEGRFISTVIQILNDIKPGRNMIIFVWNVEYNRALNRC